MACKPMEKPGREDKGGKKDKFTPPSIPPFEKKKAKAPIEKKKPAAGKPTVIGKPLPTKPVPAEKKAPLKKTVAPSEKKAVAPAKKAAAVPAVDPKKQSMKDRMAALRALRKK